MKVLVAHGWGTEAAPDCFLQMVDQIDEMGTDFCGAFDTTLSYSPALDRWTLVVEAIETEDEVPL